MTSIKIKNAHIFSKCTFEDLSMQGHHNLSKTLGLNVLQYVKLLGFQK